MSKILDPRIATSESIPELNLNTPSPEPLRSEEPLNVIQEADTFSQLLPSESVNEISSAGLNSVADCDSAAQEIARLSDEWFHDFDLSDDEPIVKNGDQIAPTEQVENSLSNFHPISIYFP